MRLRLKQTHLFYFAELSPNQLSLTFSKLENLFLCFPLLESKWLLWNMLKPEQNIHSAYVRFLYPLFSKDGINYNLSKIDGHFAH